MLNPVAKAKKLRKRIMHRAYTALDFASSLTHHLLSPYGRLASPEQRLTRLVPSAGEASSRQSSKETPERIAIFVAYSRTLTHSNRAYLEALNRAGFGILYINNTNTCPEDLPELTGLCWRAYDRQNIGRDFGAFKDGVVLLHGEGHFERCQMLCMANDSMQFIPGRNADALVHRIKKFADSQAKGLFSHISNQITAHYQSYFQILKPEIFRSSHFLNFWHRYLPLSHRRHCIYNGEIALSDQVYRRFQPVDILYTSDALLEALNAHFRQEGGIPGEDIMRLMPSPARTAEKGMLGHSLKQILDHCSLSLRLTDSQAYGIADLIENSNPSHMAAFLYPFFLDCPLVKHDLCIAGSYSIGQAICLYQEILETSAREASVPIQIESFLEEFKQLIYAKGVPMHYANKPREAAIKGISFGFVYPSTYDG